MSEYYTGKVLSLVSEITIPTVDNASLGIHAFKVGGNSYLAFARTILKWNPETETFSSVATVDIVHFEDHVTDITGFRKNDGSYYLLYGGQTGTTIQYEAELHLFDSDEETVSYKDHIQLSHRIRAFQSMGEEENGRFLIAGRGTDSPSPFVVCSVVNDSLNTLASGSAASPLWGIVWWYCEDNKVVYILSNNHSSTGSDPLTHHQLFEWDGNSSITNHGAVPSIPRMLRSKYVTVVKRNSDAYYTIGGINTSPRFTMFKFDPITEEFELIITEDYIVVSNSQHFIYDSWVDIDDIFCHSLGWEWNVGFIVASAYGESAGHEPDWGYYNAPGLTRHATSWLEGETRYIALSHGHGDTDPAHLLTILKWDFPVAIPNLYAQQQNGDIKLTWDYV